MEHATQFTFEGRYFTEGDKTNASQVWFVLHGYGQLAKYFIRKFAPLVEKSVYIIAPEGLSHYYQEDVTTRAHSGDTRVGASWMTRENRLMDIRNYVSFLNSVYQKEITGLHPPVTVFGFSQGAATASRWVMNGAINFERLILWAGIFPPDLDFESGKEILKEKKTIVVAGRSDPFLADSHFIELQKLNEKLSITPELILFNGGHDIDKDTLLTLL